MRFRQRHLFGRSSSSDEASGLLQGKFDIALVCPSWDHRCDVITRGDDLWLEDVIFLRFQTKDTQGHQARHEEDILRFLSAHARRIHLVDGDSVKVEVVWEQLWDLARSITLAGKRPKNAFIDLDRKSVV